MGVYLRTWRVVGMALMACRSTIRFWVCGVPAGRLIFGFLKDYAIRGKCRNLLSANQDDFKNHHLAIDPSFLDPNSHITTSRILVFLLLSPTWLPYPQNHLSAAPDSITSSPLPSPSPAPTHSWADAPITLFYPSLSFGVSDF